MSKLTVLILLLLGLVLLGGCGGAEPVKEPATVVEPTPVAPPALAEHPASIAVVKHFDAAKSRELTVVVSPDVTPEQIAQIRAADQRARRALTILGRQRFHVTASALAEARAAVSALEHALVQ